MSSRHTMNVPLETQVPLSGAQVLYFSSKASLFPKEKWSEGSSHICCLREASGRPLQPPCHPTGDRRRPFPGTNLALQAPPLHSSTAFNCLSHKWLPPQLGPFPARPHHPSLRPPHALKSPPSPVPAPQAHFLVCS